MAEESTTPIKEKLQVSVPPGLMKRLSLIAQAEGLSLAEVSQRGLSDWVERNYCEKIAFWSTDLT